jgi:hypothetical protein
MSPMLQARSRQYGALPFASELGAKVSGPKAISHNPKARAKGIQLALRPNKPI